MKNMEGMKKNGNGVKARNSRNDKAGFVLFVVTNPSFFVPSVFSSSPSLRAEGFVANCRCRIRGIRVIRGSTCRSYPACRLAIQNPPCLLNAETVVLQSRAIGDAVLQSQHACAGTNHGRTACHSWRIRLLNPHPNRTRPRMHAPGLRKIVRVTIIRAHLIC